MSDKAKRRRFSPAEKLRILEAADRCEKIDYAAGSPSLHLGALGPSGLTAYFTTVALGGLREGETLAFTPAAGSVGSIAGQIARILGARTVGIASTGQLAALSGFGYDAGVALDGLADLGAACPDGIDLFIDGVGGAVHEGILPRVNLRARIVLLGFIAAYNEVGPPRYGNAASVLMKRARMEGFLLADWRDRFDEARTALSGWIAEGRLRNVETVWPGLEAAPAAFSALFGEALPGKQIVTIEENLS